MFRSLLDKEFRHKRDFAEVLVLLGYSQVKKKEVSSSLVERDNLEFERWVLGNGCELLSTDHHSRQ